MLAGHDSLIGGNGEVQNCNVESVVETSEEMGGYSNAL
jgi:hypothetical protein